MSKVLSFAVTFLACAALVSSPAGAGAVGIDLALQPGSLVANPANPAPGSTVTLTVTALNLGDQVLTDIPLEFAQRFEGVNMQAVMVIGQTTIAGPFNPGDSQTISVDCTLPPISADPPTINIPHPIIAIIDPWSVYDTLNHGNDVLTLTTMLADLAVSRLSWTRLNPAFVTVTVRLSNLGVITSQPTTVTLYLDASTGSNLGSQDLPALAPGQSMDVEFPRVMTGPADQSYKIFAVADEANAVQEFDETNNTEWVAVAQAGHFPAPVVSPLAATFSGQVTVDEDGTRGETRDGGSGDEIAVFDGAGVLCGQAVVEKSGGYALAVYGDDPGTSEDEGASPGETLTVRLWDGQRQRELPVRSLSAAGTARAAMTWSDNGGGTVNLHALAQGQLGVYRLVTGGAVKWYLDADGNGRWSALDLALGGFGVATDVVAPGDWNGDGLTELGVFRGGKWYLDSNGNGLWNVTDKVASFGVAGDVPVAGDWNGDGIDDLGVFRGGKWYLDSNGSGAWEATDVKASFGVAGDVPVAGDWNGDGIDDLGVFRGGKWYLDVNGNWAWNTGDVAATFGLAGDKPVAGDWNGDGVSDFGVLRNGVWYLDFDGSRGWNGSDLILPNFGTPTDQPCAGVWR